MPSAPRSTALAGAPGEGDPKCCGEGPVGPGFQFRLYDLREHLLTLVAEECRRDEGRHREKEGDGDARLDAADRHREDVVEEGAQPVGTQRVGGEQDAHVDAPEDGDECKDHQRDRALDEGEQDGWFAEEQRQWLRDHAEPEERRIDEASLPEDGDPGVGAHQDVGQERHQHQQAEKHGGHAPRLAEEPGKRQRDDERESRRLQADAHGRPDDHAIDRAAQDAQEAPGDVTAEGVRHDRKQRDGEGEDEQAESRHQQQPSWAGAADEALRHASSLLWR